MISLWLMLKLYPSLHITMNSIISHQRKLGSEVWPASKNTLAGFQHCCSANTLLQAIASSYWGTVLECVHSCICYNNTCLRPVYTTEWKREIFYLKLREEFRILIWQHNHRHDWRTRQWTSQPWVLVPDIYLLLKYKDADLRYSPATLQCFYTSLWSVAIDHQAGRMVAIPSSLNFL